jgi:hypothetical protein
MSSTEHSLLSSYRESLLEHLFAGEVMKHVWLSGLRRLEVLKPQVDDGGYDLVLEAGNVVRHVQLKATFKGSTVNRFTINLGLAGKPSGCVVCMLFEQESLNLGPFYWLGGKPGERLPDLGKFKTAKHTKGNSLGVKTERPNLRVVPLSAFTKVSGIPEIAALLFGPHGQPVAGDA